MAIKGKINGSFGEEMEEINKQDLKDKKLVVSCSKKRKTKFKPCVCPSDMKKGKVKKCSPFEIELANIFRGLRDERPPKKEVINFTDMLLDLISRWREVEKKLLEKGLVKKSSFTKEPEEGFFLTSPLVVSAIKSEYPQKLESIYGKSLDQLSSDEILKNPSSLIFQIFEGFNILGLATRDESSKPYRYFWGKRVLELSFEQMAELYSKGRELLRRVEKGEVEGAPQKIKVAKKSQQERQKEELTVGKQVAKEEKLTFKKITVTISFTIEFPDTK